MILFSFMARPMSPAIFSLPVMNAIWPLSLPDAMSTKSEDATVIVQFAPSFVPSDRVGVPVRSTYQEPPSSP